MGMRKAYSLRKVAQESSGLSVRRRGRKLGGGVNQVFDTASSCGKLIVDQSDSDQRAICGSKIREVGTQISRRLMRK